MPLHLTTKRWDGRSGPFSKKWRTGSRRYSKLVSKNETATRFCSAKQSLMHGWPFSACRYWIHFWWNLLVGREQMIYKRKWERVFYSISYPWKGRSSNEGGKMLISSLSKQYCFMLTMLARDLSTSGPSVLDREFYGVIRSGPRTAPVSSIAYAICQIARFVKCCFVRSFR